MAFRSIPTNPYLESLVKQNWCKSRGLCLHSTSVVIPPKCQFLFFWFCHAKVGWLLLDGWRILTPPIHHIFIQFFVHFVLHKLRFCCYFCKSILIQWLRLLALDWLIVGSNPGLDIFFFFFLSKRNRKLIKNVIIWGVESCQLSS